jgi:DNA-binding NarL/FixJ family response regulator
MTPQDRFDTIVRLASEGKSRNEIALELGVSTTHVACALSVLGITARRKNARVSK